MKANSFSISIHRSVPAFYSPFRRPTMGFVALGSAVLCLASLVAHVSAGSDAPRGVALGFVFDPKATCDPPCEHAGVCIRNNTCYCSKGYEGETCQYGDVKSLPLFTTDCMNHLWQEQHNILHIYIYFTI